MYRVALSNRNLFITFCILTLLDYVSTLIVINKGGIELNRIAAIAFHSSEPVVYGLLFKLFTIVFVAIIWYIMIVKNRGDSFNRIIKFVNVFIFVIVLNNLYWGTIFM